MVFRVCLLLLFVLPAVFAGEKVFNPDQYQLAPQFSMSFTMYHRLRQKPDGDPSPPIFNKGEPVAGNTIYYRWEEANHQQSATRADWQSCPPFPGIPLAYIGKKVTFYLFYTENAWQSRAYCHDLQQWSYYAWNVGTLLPNLLARYHEFDPHPPLQKPFKSSLLPASASYTTEDILWFTTGGPPPAADQGYVGIHEQAVDGDYPLFSFAGGHMWPAGRYYLQAIYDLSSYSTADLPSDTFSPPAGYAYTPPDVPSMGVFSMPESKAQRVGLTCSACHAATSSD